MCTPQGNEEFANGRFDVISHRLMRLGHQTLSHHDFLRKAINLLLEFARCDAVELLLAEEDNFIICSGSSSAGATRITCRRINGEPNILNWQNAQNLWNLCLDQAPTPTATGPATTTRGSALRSNDLGRIPQSALDILRTLPSTTSPQTFTSWLVVLLGIASERVGLLKLFSNKADGFSADEARAWEDVAPVLGFAITSQRAQWALRERIKELTCLYGLARIAAQPEISLAEILKQTVQLLPPAWQYPEATVACIRLGDQSYMTDGYLVGDFRQYAPITVHSVERGEISVVYLEEKPELDEGPFLREERNLIDALAAQVALIVERKEAEDESDRLQKQLRHADRLATVGQLAAGVAHELNEPLSSILGFTQLVRKSLKKPEQTVIDLDKVVSYVFGLRNLWIAPEQTVSDLDKIVSSTLYAREIVKRLLYFSRQLPPQKLPVNLNRVMEEVLSFFDSRCAMEGIELIREPDPNLPEITADPAQLHQVLVNLVVNSMQAMPDGGKLVVRTGIVDENVEIEVSDTGVGMSEEVQRQVFMPFFTTKEVSQGTGIGLSVVHGIVESHGGTITVRSQPNRGTTFTVRLPYANQPESGEFIGE